MHGLICGKVTTIEVLKILKLPRDLKPYFLESLLKSSECSQSMLCELLLNTIKLGRPNSGKRDNIS